MSHGRRLVRRPTSGHAEAEGNNDRGWKEDERPVMLMSTNLRWDCGWSRCIIPHFKDKGFGEEGNEPKG